MPAAERIGRSGAPPSFRGSGDRVRGVIERLRALGVRLAIDDFGSGFSSLAHLRALPVNEIKLDRQFVAAMRDDEGSAAIVRSVAELSRSLGLVVVAEGVETAEQREQLLNLGYTFAQGFSSPGRCRRTTSASDWAATARKASPRDPNASDEYAVNPPNGGRARGRPRLPRRGHCRRRGRAGNRGWRVNCLRTRGIRTNSRLANTGQSRCFEGILAPVRAPNRRV
jgi:EAL domain-containing protein